MCGMWQAAQVVVVKKEAVLNQVRQRLCESENRPDREHAGDQGTRRRRGGMIRARAGERGAVR